MWIENEIYRQDLDYITGCSFIDWNRLQGGTVLVTGAAGMIGSLVVNSLLWYASHHSIQIHVLALVRSLESARALFSVQLQAGAPLTLIQGDVRCPPELPGTVDYIIHTAAPTASQFFLQHPADTADIIFNGTRSMLDFAVLHHAVSFVYLSTMEIYGAPDSGDPLSECAPCYLDLEAPRSCYPESKRAAEVLCTAYRAQFQLNTVVLRLTQTFGAGMRPGDQRIFAQLARCALSQQAMVLHTTGATCHCYLYTADAVTAILSALLRCDSAIMNVANEDTFCSIRSMAEQVAAKYHFPVRFDLSQQSSALGYAPTKRINLDTGRIRNTGWTPAFDLAAMYQRLIDSLR